MALVEWRRGSVARAWRLGLAVCGLPSLAALAQPVADTVILGGKVVTVDASFALAEGLASAAHFRLWPSPGAA